MPRSAARVRQDGDSTRDPWTKLGDCLRSDAKKLSPIKNLNCIMNEVNKLTTRFQNVDKDAVFRKYGCLVEIARTGVVSLEVAAAYVE
ncbi:hypothetical protein D5086_010392 [Populus alba]|uniref:Uncharacterized protein n=1 Tax=Populus alba TaxID=43335 RepID=A0ACC4C9A4_POPAL